MNLVQNKKRSLFECSEHVPYVVVFRVFPQTYETTESEDGAQSLLAVSGETMESVDRAKSLHVASDEICYNHTCDPCEYEGVKNKEAMTFCDDCKEFLCPTCTRSHKGQRMSRNHRLLNVSDLTHEQTAIKTDSDLILCDCVQHSTVNSYCEEHNQIMCSYCKLLKHKRCRTISIEEKSQSYSETELNVVSERLASLKNELDSFILERNTDLQNIEAMKDKCIDSIRHFREEFNSYLDDLEEKSIKRLDTHALKEQKEISQHIETCTTTLKSLKMDTTLLDEARKTSKKANMFSANLKMSPRLKEYQNLLQYLQKESKSPNLYFEIHEHFQIIQKNVKELGQLIGDSIKHHVAPTIDNSFTELTDKSPSSVKIKMQGDIMSSKITGCTFMPNGGVVLCDRRNSNIKILSDTFATKDSLKLDCQPFDVSPVNSNTVMVTLPEKNQLQLIQVMPSLKIDRSINVDRECWGVQVVDDLIYVTCHNNPGVGEVLILDMNGTVSHRLGQPGKKPPMFSSPDYITVCSSIRKIFITDRSTGTVSCLMADGTVVYQYKDKELWHPEGVVVAGGGNVIVCSSSSDNVQVMRADGTKCCTLLTSQPYSVAYRESDKTLILGCDNNHLLVYKM